MTIQQTVEIDPNRRVLRLDQPLPETVGTGRAKLTLIISDAGTEKRVPARIGFLKGCVSVPADFDTMGRGEIAALFEGEK
jgi:hypothetical protein